MKFDCSFWRIPSSRERLLEFVVGWPPALELEQVDHVLLVLGSPLVPQTGHEAVVESVVGFAAVEVAECDDLLHVDVHLRLAESVVLGIGTESVQLSLHIVSHDVQLVEPRPECFGCGHIVHIAQPEHVLELPVLQSRVIDVELA